MAFDFTEKMVKNAGPGKHRFSLILQGELPPSLNWNVKHGNFEQHNYRDTISGDPMHAVMQRMDLNFSVSIFKTFLVSMRKFVQ